jgi:hypothetical protein
MVATSLTIQELIPEILNLNPLPIHIIKTCYLHLFGDLQLLVYIMAQKRNIAGEGLDGASDILEGGNHLIIRT